MGVDHHPHPNQFLFYSNFSLLNKADIQSYLAIALIWMIIEMYRNHFKKPTVTINDSTWYNLNNTDGNLLNNSPLHNT